MRYGIRQIWANLAPVFSRRRFVVNLRSASPSAPSRATHLSRTPWPTRFLNKKN